MTQEEIRALRDGVSRPMTILERERIADHLEALTRENFELRAKVRRATFDNVDLQVKFGEALADKELLERERDYAVGKEREVAATIKRVWAALGNPEFETLHGRTISEVVADWKDRAEAAERRLAEQGQGEAVHEITQECRYCANTGWFYGDPDLHSYCGCAFGKLREELSAAPPSPEPDEQQKMSAALTAAGITLDPVADGGGAWHYEAKLPEPDAESARLRDLLFVADHALMEAIGYFPADRVTEKQRVLNDACWLIRQETSDNYEVRRARAETALRRHRKQGGE